MPEREEARARAIVDAADAWTSGHPMTGAVLVRLDAIDLRRRIAAALEDVTIQRDALQRDLSQAREAIRDADEHWDKHGQVPACDLWRSVHPAALARATQKSKG